MTTERKIILYDGLCNFCNSSIRFISTRDKRHLFSYLPLSSSEGEALLEEQDLPTGDNDSVVYIKGDNIYIRSTAILHIFRDMRGFLRMLYLFIIVPEFIRDFFYKIIANNRYRLSGRCQTCNK